MTTPTAGEIYHVVTHPIPSRERSSLANEEASSNVEVGAPPRAGPVKAARRRAVRVNEDDLVLFEPLAEAKETSEPRLGRPGAVGVDLPAWTLRHRPLIERTLYQHGAILFRGFGTNTLESFKAFSQSLVDKLDGYDERTSPRKELGDNVFTSTIYPKDQPLHFHNANSYSTFWPMKIWFGCIVKAPVGGRTPLSDCRRVADHLDPKLLARFDEKGVCYVRNFMPGMGLTWQETFGSDDRHVVEEYCRREEIRFEWVSPTHLRTVQIRPARATHPVTKERLWFNQASLFHVTMLRDGIAERFLEDFPEKYLPSNSYYGDGTPISKGECEEILAAYEAAALRFDWEVGDIAVLDNMLFAHAREPFEGDRLITVAFSGRLLPGASSE